MKPIPNDCSHCYGPESCTRRHTCRRTVPAPDGAYRTVWSAYEGGSDCTGYWPEEADT